MKQYTDDELLLQWLYYSTYESCTISHLKQWLPLSMNDKLVETQNRLTQSWISMMIYGSTSYHSRRSSLERPPYILSYWWNIWLLDADLVWIVWPRKASLYGERATEDLCGLLPREWVATVSWWADGIDRCAHHASIRHGIPTIVVLGWWLRYYLNNKQMRRKLREIVDHGWLVLSEYKIDQQAAYYTFPQRNRLIAWLADWLFVPEAGEKSWTMLTVNHALAMKKPVITIPHELYSPHNAGLLSYIQTNQVVVSYDLWALVQRYCWQSAHIKKSTDHLSDDEQLIYWLVQWESSCSIDRLVIQSQQPVWLVMSVLCSLELQWLVRTMRPGEYVVV